MSLYIAENYTQLCTIEADLSGVPMLPQPKATGTGTFFRVHYDLVLLFGLTELKAQLAWQEDVSGFQLHLSKPIDIRFISLTGVTWFSFFLGKRETVRFYINKGFIFQSSLIFIRRSATKIVYDPDNDE